MCFPAFAAPGSAAGKMQIHVDKIREKALYTRVGTPPA